VASPKDDSNIQWGITAYQGGNHPKGQDFYQHKYIVFRLVPANVPNL
jgi:hypothetical protein